MTRTLLCATALTGAALLGGCATITSGTTQNIAVNTTPTEASCTLTREGQVIAEVNPTPASVEVDRTRQDILVTCDKEGFETGESVLVSGTEGSTYGNILAGGLIGAAIDQGSGAVNKYPSAANVVLTPISQPTTDPAATGEGEPTS
ncbi:MAG: hypothetical protein AAF415_06335 [Pseudomonadota bacterium]